LDVARAAAELEPRHLAVLRVRPAAAATAAGYQLQPLRRCLSMLFWSRSAYIRL
jgi:hypothetical protein